MYSFRFGGCRTIGRRLVGRERNGLGLEITNFRKTQKRKSVVSGTSVCKWETKFRKKNFKTFKEKDHIKEKVQEKTRCQHMCSGIAVEGF